MNNFERKNDFHQNGFNQTNEQYEQDTVKTEYVGTNFLENPENCILPGECMPVFETINLVTSSESEIESSSLRSSLSSSSRQDTSTEYSPVDTEVGSYGADDEKSNSEISPTYTEDDSSTSGKGSRQSVAGKSNCLSHPVESSIGKDSCAEMSECLDVDDNDWDSFSPVLMRKKKYRNVLNSIENSPQKDFNDFNAINENKVVIDDVDSDTALPVFVRKKKTRNVLNSTHPLPEDWNENVVAVANNDDDDDNSSPIIKRKKKKPNILNLPDYSVEKDKNEANKDFNSLAAAHDNDDDDDSSSPMIGRKRKQRNVFNDSESDDDLPEEMELVDGYNGTVNSNIPRSKGNRLVSDFDRMMQQKRTERQRGRKRSDGFTTDNDDLIDLLIDRMEYAAYADRRLNARGRPAIKKVSMLKYVMSQLIKKDLQLSFLEHNILGTLREWLSPLPSKCLPCLPIRDNILRLLMDFPLISSELLRYSGIGRAVIYLRDHPEETKENRERCSQLVANWARPIHDLSCDYKTMSKEERQQRDVEMSLRHTKQKENGTSTVKRVRVDTLDQALDNSMDCEAVGPGDPGWVPRARVPQPSTRDYINRPKPLIDCQLSKISKPNRYEIMAKKYVKAKKMLATHRSGAKLSILGRNM